MFIRDIKIFKKDLKNMEIEEKQEDQEKQEKQEEFDINDKRFNDIVKDLRLLSGQEFKIEILKSDKDEIDSKTEYFCKLFYFMSIFIIIFFILLNHLINI